jgi:hypothetical protein
MVNQKPTDLGIPNRFNLTTFRFRQRLSSPAELTVSKSSAAGIEMPGGGFVSNRELWISTAPASRDRAGIRDRASRPSCRGSIPTLGHGRGRDPSRDRP